MLFQNKHTLLAHLGIFSAAAIWGLMAPIGKDAMNNGITGIDMVTFRVFGAAICFWLTSIFSVHERVQKKDLFKLFFAGLFAIVFNQCAFTIGLSKTSPINTSIVTTTLPIVALVFSAIFLHERITLKKIFGIACGVLVHSCLFSGAHLQKAPKPETFSETPYAFLYNAPLPYICLCLKIW